MGGGQHRFRCKPGNKLLHGPEGQRLRRLPQQFSRNGYFLPGANRFCRKDTGALLQIIAVPPEGNGTPAQSFHNARIARQQQGQHLMANIISGVIGILIGRILHMGKIVGREVSFDFSAAGREQGANQCSALCRNASHPFQSGSPEKMEQHGFRIVLRVVGGGNGGGMDFLCRFTQERITPFSCRLLQRQALPGGTGGNILAPHIKGNLPLAAKVRAKGGILPGLRPYLMVKVGSGHGKPLLLSLRMEQVQQADRIRAPGKGTQHHTILRQELLPCAQRLKCLHHGSVW